MQATAEYGEWSRLHDLMKGHHEFLETRFARIYEDADKHGPNAPQERTLRLFLNEAISLEEDLRLHQTTEDQGLYPVLAERMAEFAGDHTDEHKKIAERQSQLSAYLESARANPRTYSAARLREIMDALREPLFAHMANEVESLQGHNLMLHYTLEELRRLPV